MNKENHITGLTEHVALENKVIGDIEVKELLIEFQSLMLEFQSIIPMPSMPELTPVHLKVDLESREVKMDSEMLELLSLFVNHPKRIIWLKDFVSNTKKMLKELSLDSDNKDREFKVVNASVDISDQFLKKIDAFRQEDKK